MEVKRETELPELLDKHKLEDLESPEEVARQFKKFQSAPKFNFNSEEVFCICRRPDHGGELMVGCDGCDEWFHFKCMKLDPKYSSLIHKFYCKFCQWQELGNTRWKRKCRTPWCYNPIAGQSKYCSYDCSLNFMRKTLRDGTLKASLSPEQTKAVLNYGDLTKIKQLGMKLPETEEVRQFKSNGDISAFNSEVQLKLAAFSDQITRANDLLMVYNTKAEYLIKYREKLKIINETITSLDSSAGLDAKKSRSKLKKGAKCELCGFDKNLNTDLDEWKEFLGKNGPEIDKLLKSTDIGSDFASPIAEIVAFYNKEREPTDSWFNETLCVNDKRKCLRHGGWWNLINDDIARLQDELQAEILDIEKERAEVLHEYNVDKLEGRI